MSFLRFLFGLPKVLRRIDTKLKELDRALEIEGKKVDALALRVASLQNSECPQAAALDRALKEIQTEWDRMYNKFRSLYANWAKAQLNGEPGGERPDTPQPINPAAERLTRRW